MAHAPASDLGSGNILCPLASNKGKSSVRGNKYKYRRLALLAAAVFLSPLVLAQGNAQITGVDPSTGKVNDSITVTGENLGKGSVSAVFLSDDKEDFKAAIVEQSQEKIVVKVPQVKSGSYNVSIQVADKILIKPVRFTVEE